MPRGLNKCACNLSFFRDRFPYPLNFTPQICIAPRNAVWQQLDRQVHLSTPVHPVPTTLGPSVQDPLTSRPTTYDSRASKIMVVLLRSIVLNTVLYLQSLRAYTKGKSSISTFIYFHSLSSLQFTPRRPTGAAQMCPSAFRLHSGDNDNGSFDHACSTGPTSRGRKRK